MASAPVPLSILDLAAVGKGETIAESFAGSVELAKIAERGGYRRIWYAEHHNISSIASSATAVLIAHVAAQTETIRLGAGGVMLPNHSPLVIAEQFGTLETLHPGRIDLGLGRAPGTDQRTWTALRRDPHASDRFPQASPTPSPPTSPRASCTRRSRSTATSSSPPSSSPSPT